MLPRSLEAMEAPNSHPIWRKRLKNLIKYQHFIIVPYHPQENSMAERRMKEVGAHLRALENDHRIKAEWGHYLPFVQRIINYTVITGLLEHKLAE